MEARCFSVDELGKFLGVSSDTVHCSVDKHAMPAHHIDHLWKFKKVQFDARVEGDGATDRIKKGSDK